MAKLQAKTVGSTEDYVVTREFRHLATEAQRISVLRACFAIAAVNETISAEESSRAQRDRARSSTSTPATVNAVRADYHEKLSSVQEVRRVAGAD